MLFCRDAVFGQVDTHERTAPLVLTTETPVDRGDYLEVLDCSSSDSCDLSRAPLPLIVAHDTGTLPVGVVSALRVEGGKLRGVARFGSSARAVEVFEDVRAGILRSVSIGYTHLDDGVPIGTRRALKFKFCPHEVSVVAVPADPGAGFYRSKEFKVEDTLDQAGDAARMTRSQRRANQTGDGNDPVSEIAAMGSLGLVRGGEQLAAEYLASGRRDVSEFRRVIMDRASEASEASARVARPSIDRRELRDYSLMRAIRAMVDPNFGRVHASLELEVSNTLARESGRDPRGLFVPEIGLLPKTRDLTVGTATAGGHLVGTQLLASSYIEQLRERLLVVRLGATVLPGLRGNIAIPRKTSGATVQWVGEGSAATEGAIAFDQVTMSPKSVSGWVDISRKLLLQATPEVEALARADLDAGLAIGIDAAAINGSGSGSEPRGILNTVGIGSAALGTNGAAPTWAMIQELIREVGVDNALAGRLGFLTNSKAVYKMATTPRQASGVEGNFLLPADSTVDAEGMARLAGYRMGVSGNVPSTLTKGSASGVCSALIFGNWADLIIGTWSVVDLVVDPYTSATTGAIRVTAFQDVDIAVRHPQSFAACVDMLTT